MVRIQIPYIQGDGVGADIWDASHGVLEEAVWKASGGAQQIEWIPLLAGERAIARTGKPLPEETEEAIRASKVALKGPLTTPVGGGHRSVNVHLRQAFNLYVGLRPVRYFEGLPSPLKRPERIDLVLFRENTEDLYQGIEWEEGTSEAGDLIRFLRERRGLTLPPDTGLGLKPMSRGATRRFAKRVLEYAIKHKRKAVTIVHKGNIMKYTEGAFRKWTYEMAEEYKDYFTVAEEGDKIRLNDRLADNMFMQVILRPEDYDVLLCPNLNGDYLSDACAALIGGLGVVPGGGIGDEVAIFEPVHGSAPKYAGQDVVNPTGFILSGAMLFEHLGLTGAASYLQKAVEATVKARIVTYDLARQMEGVTPVRCSAFAAEVARRIGEMDLPK